MEKTTTKKQKQKTSGATGTLALKKSQQGVESIVLANEAEIQATSGIYQVWECSSVAAAICVHQSFSINGGNILSTEVQQGAFLRREKCKIYKKCKRLVNLQYKFIARCQYNCTRNVLGCQVHSSSHIHNTLNYKNSKQTFG